MKEIEIGTKFGAWTVLEKLSYAQKYRCQCDCGRERNIRVYDLLKGKSIMCKACSTAHAKQTGRTGGGKYDSEYNIWVHINQRCHNPNNKDYKNYGGRGIEVCELWRDSFDAFLLQMGPKPDPSFTIERIDYNLGYNVDNCKWISREDQTRNKRDNIQITIDGETKTASEWARDPPRCAVSATALYKRIARGWDPERAVLQPSKK